MKQRWKRHRWVIGVLAVLVVGCDTLLWLHPSLGFAHGGILNGADLRGSIIQISLWLLFTFGLVATVALWSLSSIKRDVLVYLFAYGLALAASAAAIVILDKFF